MARGFGSTYGVSGTTDEIETSFTGNNTQRSYALWSFRAGTGGGGVGRMFEKPASNDWFGYNSGVYRYARQWSSTTGAWTMALPTLNEWHHLGISYNGSSTANDPLMYDNGSSVTVTELTAPSGSNLQNNSNAFLIGNRSLHDAAWNGMLAEFAIWNAILTAQEFAVLAKGASPLMVRPQALVLYYPLLGPIQDLIGSGTITPSGTAVQPHPRAYYPSRVTRNYVASAATPRRGSFGWAELETPDPVSGARPALVSGKLTNSLLLGGLLK